ncbi:MAG: hypothetical protein ACXWXF_00550 [Aeromicrobium sp.]
MAGLTEQGGGYVVLMNQDHLIQSNLLTGREARSGWLGMRFYGAVLLLVFALWLFFTIRSVFRLRGWRERSRRRSAGSLAWDIGSHFLMAALLVLLMYQLVPALIGRGFNLTDVGRYYFLPDLTLLVFGSVVADLAQGSYRLVTVLVTRFFVRERFAGP